MAKTKPIGVRFDENLLETVKTAGLADSPQKALNLYEKSYLELVDLKIDINNEPQNKAQILDERENKPIPPKAEETTKNGIQNHSNDKTTNDSTSSTVKHNLWKQGDPKENSAGFYMKYGVSNYEELKNKNNEKDT